MEFKTTPIDRELLYQDNRKMYRSFLFRDLRGNPMYDEEIFFDEKINLDYKELLEICDKSESTGLNMFEIIFFMIFKKRGYTITRMPLPESSRLSLRNIHNRLGIEKESLQGVGVPDFLIEKDGEYKFVEVKSPTDRLHPSQKSWIKKYKYNTSLFILIPEGYNLKDMINKLNYRKLFSEDMKNILKEVQ